MSFLTVEDINTSIYNNPWFYWHTIDLGVFKDVTGDLINVKYDFVTINREEKNGKYEFSVTVENSLWKGYAFSIFQQFTHQGGQWGIKCVSPTKDFKIYLYMGDYGDFLGYVPYRMEEDYYEATIDKLHKDWDVSVKAWSSNLWMTIEFTDLKQGYNLVKVDGRTIVGYYYVKLLKTDLQFDCAQKLNSNTINKVKLGVDSKYKPNGALISTYSPNIVVEYNNEIIKAYWDSTVNDYCFDLDLTKTDANLITFTVNVDENEVINKTSTSVTLNCDYKLIATYNELANLLRNGGAGRLRNSITLLDSLTINNDVLLIGDENTLNLNGHQLILSESRTLKADNIIFSNGVKSIHQKTHSTLILTECTFKDCTGFGSCIECDIDLHSLDTPNDFNTTITNCTFNNNDMCLLHGGNITINDCTIEGKIANPNHPYFLYLTDGDATLSQNRFNISSQTTITSDVKYNSCIFSCGETAKINGLSHAELQNNNMTTFLDNNQSTINLKYYYNLISDYITLQSNKGYCHSVSGVNFVFKTNIQLSRGE